MALLISAVLHGAALYMLFTLMRMITDPQPLTQPLQIELFGMISNRQTQEQRIGSELDHTVQPMQEQEQQPAAPVVEAETENPPEEPISESILEPETPKEIPQQSSPVQVPPPPSRPRVEPQPQRVTPRVNTAQESVPALRGAQETQVQQTIQNIDMRALINLYVKDLIRDVQRNLVYPNEARKEGLVGTPVIRFTLTESGEIVPGSLSVHKSSGYSILDQYALQAVRESVPFTAPPKQITVNIAISFAEKI